MAKMDDERPVANNAPKYDYKCRLCGFTDESHIRESLIWSCPYCSEPGEPVPLYRSYSAAPNMPRVWHGHMCNTTGQWITDRKQFREALHVASEEATQRLGMEHRFIEVDPSDRDSLGVTDQGLDATHDAHVKLGIKQSKGQFVFPMSGRNTYTREKPST